MLEWIGVGLLIFMILTFFYKQAIHDFRINQANYPSTELESLSELWKERVPLVIRELPKIKLWTHEDVITRPCYEHIPLFKEKTLVEWLKEVYLHNHVICPWRYEEAERIAMTSGIQIWVKKHIQSVVGEGLLKLGWGWWNIAKYYAWAGNRGLHRTYAIWTCILPVEEEIIVTIFPERMESYLPLEWKNSFPSEWTPRDTPFVEEIKYMDIVVRPETILCLPPHWFVSWRKRNKENGSQGNIPMVYTFAYHSPISLFAFHMAKGK